MPYQPHVLEKKHNFWCTPKGDKPLANSNYTVNKLIHLYDLKLDPCCDGAHNCLVPPELGGYFYTPKEDGLTQSWKDNAIFNPPFSMLVRDSNNNIQYNKSGNPKWRPAIGDWCYKALHEARKHKTIVIGILPANTDTKWFHDTIYNELKCSDYKFLQGRIKYTLYNKPCKSPPFASMLVFWDFRDPKYVPGDLPAFGWWWDYGNKACGLWTEKETNWSQDDTDFIQKSLSQLNSGSPTSYKELEQRNEAKINLKNH